MCVRESMTRTSQNIQAVGAEAPEVPEKLCIAEPHKTKYINDGLVLSFSPFFRDAEKTVSRDDRTTSRPRQPSSQAKRCTSR